MTDELTSSVGLGGLIVHPTTLYLFLVSEPNVCSLRLYLSGAKCHCTYCPSYRMPVLGAHKDDSVCDLNTRTGLREFEWAEVSRNLPGSSDLHL